MRRIIATRDEAYNSPYFKSNNEPNNVANNCRSNDWYHFTNIARYSDEWILRLRSRFRSRWSERCN